MASNFNDPSFRNSPWALKRYSDQARWPLLATLCLSVGLSALLWLSLFNLLGVLG